MSDKSLIEWTEATWNPVRGCEKVSPGCKHCYAETFAERFRGTPGHPFEQGFDPRLVPEMLDQPLRWKRGRLVFVNSMSDLFGEFVPDYYIARVFGVMRSASRHTFQVLTKRAERLPQWFQWATEPARALDLASVSGFDGSILPNVWLGVSVESAAYLPRIEHLLRTPAAVRFLSIEPLLGAVDLSLALPRTWGRRSDGRWGCNACCNGDRCDDATHVERRNCRACGGSGAVERVDWVIVGGESGPGARPMHPDWVRSIRDQCVAARVPFFFKQWGQWGPVETPRDGDVWLLSDGSQIAASPVDGPCNEPRGPERAVLMRRHAHKSDAGRVLDGRTWDEMPPRSA